MGGKPDEDVAAGAEQRVEDGWQSGGVGDGEVVQDSFQDGGDAELVADALSASPSVRGVAWGPWYDPGGPQRRGVRAAERAGRAPDVQQELGACEAPEGGVAAAGGGSDKPLGDELVRPQRSDDHDNGVFDAAGRGRRGPQRAAYP
ncbi:hypothetical protein PMKS-003701 [Pichia membranifaciens]|uniref:Uncharacterized protein n=1 Tax=Pichia membranifaciens TaxID=4926 RepID=A0A1Q2YKX7_9ASCO|nr:hypothetical protein PMKS-003701 [Pichia membranifaciens]